MKQLGTRGENELETDVPKMLERRDSGREAAITNLNLPVKLITNLKLNQRGKLRRGRLSTRMRLKFDWNESERAGPGRGGGCGKSNHLPSQNESGQQAHH